MDARISNATSLLQESHQLQSGIQSAMGLPPQSKLSLNSTTDNLSQRLSALGYMLRRMLDPQRDRLLAGYSELVALVRPTTISAIEERKEEERRYFEAKIARFNRDRRDKLRHDMPIRNFLEQKKADMYLIIAHNLKKLVEFPANGCLIERLSPEEKVDRLKSKMRSPEVERLAEIVKNHKKSSFVRTQMLSPLSRKLMQKQRRSQSSQVTFNNQPNTAREVQLSDLCTMLEDLAVVELESAIQCESQGCDAQEKRLLLESIQQKPPLAELLQRAMEKNDLAAVVSVENKLKLLEHSSMRDLAGRVDVMLAVNTINCRARESQSFDSSLPTGNAGPPQVQRHLKETNEKYIPFVKQDLRALENLSYKYEGIRAKLHHASKTLRFRDDIDNSEEDELSDEELKARIKERKNREKAKRDDLRTINVAAFQTVREVENFKRRIPMQTSIIDKFIDLEALNQRQAAIRDQIENSEGAFGLVDSSPKTQTNARDFDQTPTLSQHSSERTGRNTLERGLQERQTTDLVRALDEQMRRFLGAESSKTHSLDTFVKNEFQASFIGHLYPIRNRAAANNRQQMKINGKPRAKLISEADHQSRMLQQMQSSQRTIGDFAHDSRMSVEKHASSMSKTQPLSFFTLEEVAASEEYMHELHKLLLQSGREAAEPQGVAASTQLNHPTPEGDRRGTSQEHSLLDHKGGSQQTSQIQKSLAQIGASHEQLARPAVKGLSEQRAMMDREKLLQDHILASHERAQVNPSATGSEERQKEPLKGHFSTMSLKIILSPRKGSESSPPKKLSPLKQSISQHQHIFNPCVNQNESTASLLNSNRDFLNQSMTSPIDAMKGQGSSKVVFRQQTESQDEVFYDTLKRPQEATSQADLLQILKSVATGTPPTNALSANSSAERLKRLDQLIAPVELNNSQGTSMSNEQLLLVGVESESAKGLMHQPQSTFVEQQSIGIS